VYGQEPLVIQQGPMYGIYHIWLDIDSFVGKNLG